MLSAALRFLARIRTRLLLINLILAAVPLVGISFAELHEKQLLAALERDMIHQGTLLREVLEADPIPRLAGRSGMLARAAQDTRTRIRILDARGAVMSDSHRAGPPEGAERALPKLWGTSPTHVAEVPEPVDLAARPEIKRALAGRYGAATRLWEAQDRVYLFSALPMHSGGVVYVTKSTRDVKLQLFQLRSYLVKFLLVTVLGTAFITLLLATTIARPLGRLTRRAQRIAAHQRVERDPDLDTRRDEIGQLARAVAAMTDELERRAKDARTLAADISHEFKTPLTGIRGAAELLRDGAADDPAAREQFLAMIVDDADRLARLVSRLLELARVDEDRGTTLPVDLRAVADAIATRYAIVDVTGAGTAVGRAPALASAIENLVANAVQHAAPDTRVTIAVCGARVEVANHGPALSADAQARCWDRFYSTRSHAGGSGLGLAIVRSVALAHDGRYGVTCDAGVTRFWFDVTVA